MLRNQPEAHHQRIVEASSGSTVLSQAMIARALWGHEDVHAYVTNKKHPDSLKLLRFFGIHVSVFHIFRSGLQLRPVIAISTAALHNKSPTIQRA
jgi:cysteine synthase